MTAKRLRLYGLGGAALLLAAGALYLLQPEPIEAAPLAPVEPPRGAPVEPLPPAPPSVPEPARESLPLQAPPPAEEPRPARLPADARELLKALQPLRREVFAGLAELDGRIEACRLRDADLLLTLETLDQGVRILEVRVTAARADAADARVGAPAVRDDRAAHCVRGALERTIISAPSAVAGRQWQMGYWPGMSP